MLRDFKLARFTGACSPVIYRDEVFGPTSRGDAFVCEPCGNFVRRSKVADAGGELAASNAYRQDEFLASSDERFRPVDLKVGPDGGLYVVDMYRGIVQHKNFVTTFLRKQILERGLDKPLGHGRIYRVLPREAVRRAVPGLDSASVEGLVRALEHPSGWCRDHAQRLLIGRGADVVAPVEELIRASLRPLARLHGLWVLEGVGGLSVDTLVDALRDGDPQVRCAALRLSEPWLSGAAGLRQRAVELVLDQDRSVVLQAVLSLGAVPKLARASVLPVLLRSDLPAHLAAAALTGLQGQELEMLELLVRHPQFKKRTQGRRRLLLGLVNCVLKEAQPARIGRLLSLVVGEPRARDWQASAVLGEVASHLDRRAKSAGTERVLTLPTRPQALIALAAESGPVARVIKRLAWPGRPQGKAAARVLSKSDQRRIKKGRKAYMIRCMACHQMHGKGQPGLAPGLVGSEYVTGSVERLAAAILHGVSGPIVVNGEKFNGVMPPAPATPDDEVALIMSFVRNAWGHQGSTVGEKFVTGVREKYKARGARPFTAAELDKIK